MKNKWLRLRDNSISINLKSVGCISMSSPRFSSKPADIFSRRTVRSIAREREHIKISANDAVIFINFFFSCAYFVVVVDLCHKYILFCSVYGHIIITPFQSLCHGLSSECGCVSMCVCLDFHTKFSMALDSSGATL